MTHNDRASSGTEDPHRTYGRVLYELFRLRPPTTHLNMYVQTIILNTIYREIREANEDGTDPARIAYWNSIDTLMHDRMNADPRGTTAFMDDLEYLVSPTPPPRRPPHPGPRPLIVWDSERRMLRSWGVWVEDAFASPDVHAALRDLRATATCSHSYTAKHAYDGQIWQLDCALEGRIPLETFRSEVRRAPWYQPTTQDEY